MERFDAQMTQWMNENPAPSRRCRDRTAVCHAECGRFRSWEHDRAAAREKLGPEAVKQSEKGSAGRRKRLAAYNMMKGKGGM